MLPAILRTACGSEQPSDTAGQDLISNAAVEPLDHRRAALQPVAAIDVDKTRTLMHRGVMHVAAYNAVGAMLGGQRRDVAFERAEIIDTLLDTKPRPFRQRPMG